MTRREQRRRQQAVRDDKVQRCLSPATVRHQPIKSDTVRALVGWPAHWKWKDDEKGTKEVLGDNNKLWEMTIDKVQRCLSQAVLRHQWCHQTHFKRKRLEITGSIDVYPCCFEKSMMSSDTFQEDCCNACGPGTSVGSYGSTRTRWINW